MRRQTNIRQTRGDRIFGAVDTLLLAVVFLIIAYPLYFVVIILPDCQTYYKASAVDFITGVRDIDADWDSYIETLKGMGIEEAISMCQGAYDNYMAQISK